MLTLLIALLMSLGFINSADDYHNAAEAEKQDLQEVIIGDMDIN